MAVVSGPKAPIPRPTGLQIPGALTKHVVLDPGIAYVLADALMFWGTNPVGMAAMASAVCIAAGLKTVTVLQPKFLEKHPKIMALANDDRVPLRAGGLAMLLVTGATVAMGAWIPAAASFFFAIANFGLAESASKKHIIEEQHKAAEHKPMTRLQKAVTLFKRPDIYLNIGFAMAGLMAGGASALILPLVGAAFVVGTRNTFAGKAEYEGHPKLLTAAAAGLFACVGFVTGHGLVAAAHLVNAVVLAEMERRMTPGGFPQIMKDIHDGVGGMFGSLFGRKPKPAVAEAAEPKPAPAPIVPAVFSEDAPELRDAFRVSSIPVPVEVPKQQPAPQPEALRPAIAA